MRNFAIVGGALLVLVVGFVLATRADEADAPTTSAGVTTTETVTTEAGPSTAKETAAPEPEPDPAPKPRPEPVRTVAFAGGEPKGGVQKLTFSKGEDVTFRVTSDVAEEIHVHGFDITKDIEAGKSVTFAFPAKFDGKYEVEMEGSTTEIASLEIQP